MYSKTYLSQLTWGSAEYAKVHQHLVDKITANEELSLAEEFFACDNLRVSFTDDGRQYPVYHLDGCANSNFVYIYLTHYKDVDCYCKVYRNGKQVSIEESNSNRQYLQNISSLWLNLIKSEQHNKILIYLRQEVKHQSKIIIKYCKNTGLGHFRKEYLIKNTILHSKFVYLRVKEFFQELGTEVITFDIFNHKILIDSFFFIHILFRHYAASIKEHQQDKSYHIENFDYKSMPIIMKNIILMYSQYVNPQCFNRREIAFTFNNLTYMLWFKDDRIEINGNNIPCLRLQTFYPVDSVSDKLRLGSYTKVQGTDGIIFLTR